MDTHIKKGKNIMKKIIKMLTAAALAAVLCAGCAANDGSGSTDEVVVINNAADLEGKTIGVQLGTTGDIFAGDIKDVNIERYKRGAEAVMALTQGKVDAVIIDNQPAGVFVEKNEGLVILEEEFAVEEYAIAIKKGNTELTTAINGALAELKADGTLDEITAYWIGTGSEESDAEEVKKHGYISPEGIEYPNGTLVMATNAEFPPYESIADGEVVGFDVDMMRAVCDKLGYQLEIENIDFDSIIASVNSGKADVGAAGMTVTEDRLQNIDFSDPYTTATQVIIVREESNTEAGASNAEAAQ